MKKTVYFTSKNQAAQQVEIAIQEAITKRDSWLSQNNNIIAKIDNEDIKFMNWNSANQHVIVTILLTYYPKKK